MDIDRIHKWVKSLLSEERYDHSVRVAETAVQLAKHYNNGDLEQIYIAGLVHDCAKCIPKDTLKQLIESYHLPTELYHFHHELWHGPVGAMYVKETYPSIDESVINAIYYHTTGRAGMGFIERILFVADYIEPARSFPGVEKIRQLAFTNLYVAIQQALKNTIIYLAKQEVSIYPDTFNAYNYYTIIKESD